MQFALRTRQAWLEQTEICQVCTFFENGIETTGSKCLYYFGYIVVSGRISYILFAESSKLHYKITEQLRARSLVDSCV